MDCPVLLLESECRDPNGNESVLPVGQAKVRMRRHVQKEPAAVAHVD